MTAVGKHENRALDAREELLNNHACRSLTKHSAEHFLEFALGFVERRHNEDALTCAQAVGLEHIGRL